MNDTIGLYIHIPFCARKCLYCDFTSYVDMLELQCAYRDALIAEMNMRRDEADGCSVSTIFIGGGTPSIMDTACIADILNSAYKCFNVDDHAEITMEANPGTVMPASLRAYKSMGINRLSLGLQAWQDELLKSIGRIHSALDFINAYEWSRQAGFDNINVDLIFGLPQQTLDQWIDTLAAVVELKPEHISCYDLQVEEGTPLYDMVRSGKIKLIDEDLDRLMYQEGVDFLQANGYQRYEVSNFSKRGFQCKHNLNYWANGFYLGFGCAAHSYMGHRRWANLNGLKDYIDAVHKCEKPTAFEEIIDTRTAMFETIMLGLRTAAGVNEAAFERQYGVSLRQRYGYIIDRLLYLELLEEDGGNIKVTDKGMNTLNSILIEFLP